eukprot:scaffold15528_cov48-Cyclotella_meneghiniana.AAC.2
MAISRSSEKLKVNTPNFAPILRTIPSKTKGHIQARHGRRQKPTSTTTQSASSDLYGCEG